MIKSFYFVSLFSLATFSLFGQSIVHKELLGRPTDHSITVQAFFDTTVQAAVQYGLNTGVYTSQTPWQTFSSIEPTEILVDGLNANTPYVYRLIYRLPGETNFTARPEYTFQTQRAVGSEFTFIVQADPHLDASSDTALYSLCLKNQLEDNPDFMIDLGDFLMSDKLRAPGNVIPHDTVPFRCHVLRSFYEKQSHSVPLFNVLGNHEGETGWYQNGTSENVAIWSTIERKKYFVNPSPDGFYSGDTASYPFVGKRESYYSWTWGDALFIVIDPYWFTAPKPDSLHGWRWTLGEAQYNWLRNTLESSNSKFKFIFSHQIVGGDAEGRGGSEASEQYEWGGNNLDGSPGFAQNRPGWYKPIRDLLAENRVNIFFHGHDHFFGKQERNCLIYQETPQPSLPNFQTANMAAEYGYFEGQILPNAGHLRVTVNGDGVQVDYVRVYLPQNENGNRHNKDVSATYYIGANNCYDSLITSTPIVWNSNYSDELIYPNPFVKETKIEFLVKQSERTHLEIRNDKGQIIRKLIDNTLLNKGKFEVMWDGNDANGNKVSTGIYFYTIQGEISGSKSGKIILNNE